MPIRQDRIPDPMSPALMTAFSRTVSHERWRTYLQPAGFDQNRALRLYLWNVAVGQSFHFPLQSAEVALRNVVHSALQSRFGPDWWQDAGCRAVLDPSAIVDMTKAADRHRRKYNAEPSTAQIVASMTIGFWASLLKRRYDRPIWDHEAARAFPHLAFPDTIGTVHRLAMDVQELRNRIFHHEPLIGRNLTADYSDVIRLIGWICDDTRAWVRLHSSVPRVIRDRPR